MAIRFGRYETLEALAVGGMAKVYRGVARGEAGFERPVAIKIMHPHIAADPDFVNMFLDEARVAARVHHPNVVATQDIQRTPAGIFLVMDFVDGVDLALLVRAMRQRSQRIEPGIVVRVLIETLKGLQAVHELTASDGTSLNVVHRDVSPQNILIDRSGFVKITDFGVAHAAERLSTTHGGELKGKMGYIAPEHVGEGKIDARSDVYAAGVVLWELLTGQRLFKADERIRVLADIMAGRVEDPSHLVSDLPPALSAICLRALSLEPAARFGSAAEFASALRDGAEQSGIKLAEAEDLAALVESSQACELAASSRETLNGEESTLADVSNLRPVPTERAPRQQPQLRGWLALALGSALGLAGVLYGVFKRPPATLATADSAPSTRVSVTAMPTLAEPAQLVRATSEMAPPAGSGKREPRARKPKRRPAQAASGRMYHPSGL